MFSRNSAVAIAVSLALTACHSGRGSSPTSPSTHPSLPAGFTLSGDPESNAGATWRLQATDGGVAYDLQGMLRKPPGSGPFPAVVISHGYGSNVADYPSRIAREMTAWGLVCVAVNYTHAGGVPLGAPGSASDIGASAANVLRARKTLDLLAGLGYVDLTRVAAHGHSMGAFVTMALVAGQPAAFRAASHTAGGVAMDVVRTPVIPGEADAAGIRTPYQLHHGDADTVVPLPLDQLLDAALARSGVAHELLVYAGARHDDVATSALMLDRVRAWYAAHGMF